MNQPVFTDAERVALAGFLAGYRGLTREACSLDLRQFASWCRTRSVALFAVRRVDIEGFARDLEARVTRRLSTIAGFYEYAVQEEFLDRSPAVHVRRPRVDYESHAVALDRNELGALLVTAGLGPPLEHALISLRSSPRTRCGTRSSPTSLDAGSLCVMCKKRPRTRTRAPRFGMTGRAAAWTGMPPVSSPSTWQALPGNPALAAPSWRRKPPEGAKPIPAPKRSRAATPE